MRLYSKLDSRGGGDCDLIYVRLLGRIREMVLTESEKLGNLWTVDEYDSSWRMLPQRGAGRGRKLAEVTSVTRVLLRRHKAVCTFSLEHQGAQYTEDGNGATRSLWMAMGGDTRTDRCDVHVSHGKETCTASRFLDIGAISSGQTST